MIPAQTRDALVVFGELVFKVLWVEAPFCVIALRVTAMLGLQCSKGYLSHDK